MGVGEPWGPALPAVPNSHPSGQFPQLNQKPLRGTYGEQEKGPRRSEVSIPGESGVSGELRWMLRRGHTAERRRALPLEAEHSVIYQASQRRLCSKTLIDLSLPQ